MTRDEALAWVPTPSCLDAAYERDLLVRGSTHVPVFAENQAFALYLNETQNNELLNRLTHETKRPT